MKRRYRVLSKRTVDKLSASGDTIFWDAEIPGFGIRIYPSGTKSFLVQCRGPMGTRRVTLGRHDKISADDARRRAAILIDRVESGENTTRKPCSAAWTSVADLAERYLREYVATHCKPNTERAYRQTITRHILPSVGSLPIAMIGREHAAELHYRLRKTPNAANEVINALSRMLNRAEVWGLLPQGSNPCKSVTRYRTRKPERFLTEIEYQRLGEALDMMANKRGLWPSAVAALRLLVLTGCRSSEIRTLRWDDVDLERHEIRLRDSKTGPRTVPLSPEAVRVLTELPRAAENPWVVAGREATVPLAHIHHYWYRVRELAGLDDVRIHDLRHSFASRALALGEPLPMIGKLLGHKKLQTTARYTHLARDLLKESAANVATSIAADLETEPKTE